MKKRIVSLGVLLFIIITVFTAVFADKTDVTDKISIDKAKDLSIDMPGMELNIEGWDRDYVKIDLPGKDKDRWEKCIAINKNNITLEKNFKYTVYNIQPWFSLMQFPKYKVLESFAGGFTAKVYVPENVPLRINADITTIDKCTLKQVEADIVKINNSSLVKGFHGNTSIIKVEESTINEDYSLDSDVKHMNNNKYVK